MLQAKAKPAKATKAAVAPVAQPVAQPVAAPAPKLSPKAAAFALHAPLRDYMRANALVAPSPQFHTNDKNKTCVRIAGHRDNIAKATSDRSGNLLRGFCGVPSHRNAAFPAFGLDNSILAMLAASGFITISGGKPSTDAAGVTTLHDAPENPVLIAVTDAGRAYCAPVTATPKAAKA